MAAKLHLVFGGELKDPQKMEFVDPSRLDVVGVFPDFASARAAWKSAAQRTVDDAHTRYFIAHIHRLLDEEQEASATARID